MWRWWTVILVGWGLALAACDGEPPATLADLVAPARAALGEPMDGFPSWEERVVFVWSNRARADPAADLASCSVCAERACYSPRPPFVWNHSLGRAARFHSDNLVLSGCSLQHSSPCTLVSDLGSRYTPGPCNGAPSCACSGGLASCGSSGTSFGARVSLFGVSPSAENIARGRSDPVTTFYQWLHEPDSSSACGWRTTNGHRANILGGSRSLGVGKALGGSTWTQDMGGSGTPNGIVGGVHYPRTGASIGFRANWYHASAPSSAQVNIDGMCHSMTVERGSATNGTYLADVSGLGSGCLRYYFEMEVGATTLRYPSTGSFGINCTTEWVSTRPTACGACTPTCSGRMCGDDGCGGSCGSCSGGKTCNASGACVCPSGQTDCGGTCVDTSTNNMHCGSCANACPAGRTCSGGACLCTPSCSGRMCGDDGCGGSCGSCSGGKTCNASGACVCPSGQSDCGGTCIDTSTSTMHCGRCGNACAVGQVCTAGACACVPSCSGRMCGDDGCGGSCGACGPSRTCDAGGTCVCAAGRTDCGGTCVDVTTDPSHCGGCGMSCAMGEACSAGACTCVPSCASRTCGTDGCGGTCGACDIDEVCAGGECVCGAGLTACGGTCVDVRVDASNCGACGSACSRREMCVAGACTMDTPDGGCAADCTGRACGPDACGGSCGTCEAGRLCGEGGACLCEDGATDCDGVCTDLRSDDVHCGECGNVCAAGQRCVSAVCEGTATPDGGMSSDAGVADGGRPVDASGIDAGRARIEPVEGRFGCAIVEGGGGGAPSLGWWALAVLAFLFRRRR